MPSFQFRTKTLFLFLIFLWTTSCGPKSRTEQPVTKVDNTKDSLAKISKPKVEDPITVIQPEKKDNKLSVPQKRPIKKIAIAPEVKKEQPKETVVEPVRQVVKEPVTETPPPKLKEEPVETPPVKVKEPEKVQPAKVDSSLASKPKAKPKGKPFYFKVVRKEDGKEISGSLQLQEAIGASQYQLVKSGEIVYLEQPRNKRGAYNIVALLPGYRQSSLIFGYNNPPIETGPNNEEIITLTLDKAKAGDFIDFNNVHFLKNTSIMRPVSKNELDELAVLLKENSKYKIKIYGYCNGTQARESYTMGTSTDFFALDPKGNKKETISSKELSLARAETVKAYLVQQGIDAKRIGTKGEGGKVPLYLEGGTLGQYNDRVEVEFVKN